MKKIQQKIIEEDNESDQKDKDDKTNKEIDDNEKEEILKINLYDKNDIRPNKNKIIENKKEEKDNKYFKYLGKSYSVDLEKIYNIRGNLIKLKKMIGLNEIKDQLIDMILYYLLDFEKENKSLMHISIEGTPGCGKTKLAKIISKMLYNLGIIKKDKVVYGRRQDFIGQYIGETGQKTNKIIKNSLGGVLFIDEAYSLGCGRGKPDIYSEECLNILNQSLSDNKNNLVCIIAGYTDKLEENFFSFNEGLTRRFPFRYKIKGYNGEELSQIFINKVNKIDWKLNDDVGDIVKFFETNKKIFKFYGGDIDLFIQEIKYTHARRIIFENYKEKCVINKTDIDNAFKKFKQKRENEADSRFEELRKTLYV